MNQIKANRCKQAIKAFNEQLKSLKNIFWKNYLKKGNSMTKSRTAFSVIKPMLCDRFKTFIAEYRRQNTKSKAGRPPKQYDFSQFFDALYQVINSGVKESYIKEHYPDISGSFKRYKALFVKSKIFPTLIKELIASKGKNIPNQFIIDSFLAKSQDGRDNTGKNPTDRGRRGIKGNIVCDRDKFVYAYNIFPANRSENKCLQAMLESDALNYNKRVSLLADSGYVGKKIYDDCKDKNIRLICQPRMVQSKKIKEHVCVSCRREKPCKNGVTCVNSSKKRKPSDPPKMSHTLHSRDIKALKDNRCYIEHVNGYLRRFRGINTKFAKKSETYITYVEMGILCLNLCVIFRAM